MRKSNLVRAILLGSAATFIAGPALAQTAEETGQQAADEAPAPEATAAANDEGGDSASENITVTARRTAENVQRVPSSISAFNERSLDRLQATDTTGLQGAVPNLNIVQGRGSSNATNIFIRGVGQPDALQTFDPAVGVYVDDVYLVAHSRQPARSARSRADRGAARAAGHAVRQEHHRRRDQVRLPRRASDTVRANGSIALGSYDQFELKGAVSGPVSDTLAARLRGDALGARRLCRG